MKKLTISSLVMSTFLLGSCISLLTSGYIAEGDKNNDKALSFEEFYAMNKTKESQIEEAKKLGITDEEHAKQQFTKIDLNHDKLITKKEIIAYFSNDAK